jgi:L-galactose dehydrogenase
MLVEYSVLGKTGLRVSRISFGASSLGGVFRTVQEKDAIRAVHAALDCGINYFDVAPAYGGTVAEFVLGKALKGVPRNRYVLSTKVGKYAESNANGKEIFDYSRNRICLSVEESCSRLGVDYFDIVHIHDIEYQGRRHTAWALSEGYEVLCDLKQQGRIGAVSFGIYPMDLWKHIFSSIDIDAALVHNHYCLSDTRLLDLLPLARDKDIGIINGSPFASGLLTDRGAPAWHPASAEDQESFFRAAEFCQRRGISLIRLALQFSSQNPEVATTLFSSANPESVVKNVHWHEEPYDHILVEEVRRVLAGVMNKQWDYK